MNSNYILLKHDIYLYNWIFKKYIRFKINNIIDIHDIIFIVQKINYYYDYSLTTDMLLTFFLDIFSLYPLNEKEMQIISIIQQKYQYDNNIYGYTSLTLWIAVMEYIKDNFS